MGMGTGIQKDETEIFAKLSDSINDANVIGRRSMLDSMMAMPNAIEKSLKSYDLLTNCVNMESVLRGNLMVRYRPTIWQNMVCTP